MCSLKHTSGGICNHNRCIIKAKFDKFTYLWPIFESLRTQPHFEFYVIMTALNQNGYSPAQEDFYVEFTGSGGQIFMPSIDYQFVYECSTSYDQIDYYSKSFAHNDTTNPLEIILRKPKSSIPPGGWSIFQALIIIGKCHTLCSACTNQLSNYCSSCVDGAYQINTTCYSTCPIGYYDNTTSTTCQLCNAYCTQCTASQSNCSSCVVQNVALESVYYNDDQKQCNTTCIDGYFASDLSPTAGTCVICDTFCTICSGTAKNCTSCSISINSSTIFLNSDLFECNTSCAVGYYENTTSKTCILCHAYCTQCTASQSNCSSCVVQNVALESVYYNDDQKQCNTTCIDGYFASDLSPTAGTCVICDTFCTICSGTAKNCTSCSISINSSTIFLNSDLFECNTSCAVGYYENTTSKTCILCHAYCTQCTASQSNCSSCVVQNVALESVYYNDDQKQCNTTCIDGYFASDLSPTAGTCVICDTFCTICSGTAKNCTSCSISINSSTIFLNSDLFECNTSCAVGYYENTTSKTCILCHAYCTQCTASQSNCSSCSLLSNTSLPIYFSTYNNQCNTSCSNGYFKNSIYPLCQFCQLKCIGTTISKTQNILKNQLSFIIQFSQKMDFVAYNYQSFQVISIDPSSSTRTISQFILTYSILSSYSYSILIQTSNFQIDDGTKFILTTKAKTVDQFNYQGWILRDNIYEDVLSAIFKGVPKYYELQYAYMRQLTEFSNNYQDFITQQYVQQFNKAGVMNFLAPGAQMSSLVVINKNDVSQNHYTVARLWSQTVFFDVPEYKQDSSKSKYVVSKEANQVVAEDQTRRLLSSSSSPNSFARTGHSFYFLVDNYIQLILIGICWLLLGLMLLLKKTCKCIKKRLQTFYFIFHKIHEISLFYIVIGVVLEFMNVNNGSAIRWVSFCFSAITIIYFMVYYFYVYYRLIRYPGIDVNTEVFFQTATVYGFFLDDIRYEQYKMIEWSWHHLLRPYNYRLMGFYKKMLIVCAMPLFSDLSMAQITILIIIQSLDIVRFLITIPFSSIIKNISIFLLQTTLLSYFISSYINESYSENLLLQNGDPNQESYLHYYNSGRAAMIFVSAYNIGYMLINIIEFVVYCCYGCRKRMEGIRRQYYNKKLQEYEQKGSYYKILGKYNKLEQNQEKSCYKSKYLELINYLHQVKPKIDYKKQKSTVISSLITKGNLLEIQWQTLPIIPLPIQEYQITKDLNQNKYNLRFTRVAEMKMKQQFNFEVKNNVRILKRINHAFELKKSDSEYYLKVDGVYKKYAVNRSVQSIFIRTYQEIDQNYFNPGQDIKQDLLSMKQKVFVVLKNHNIKVYQLEELIDGFPVDLKTIIDLL